MTDSINLSLGMSYGEISCLVDSVTTHTTLHEHEYFTKFIPTLTHMTTILGPSNLIEGHGTTMVLNIHH